MLTYTLASHEADKLTRLLVRVFVNKAYQFWGIKKSTFEAVPQATRLLDTTYETVLEALWREFNKREMSFDGKTMSAVVSKRPVHLHAGTLISVLHLRHLRRSTRHYSCRSTPVISFYYNMTYDPLILHIILNV